MRAVGKGQAGLPSESDGQQLLELLDGLVRLRPELGALADELICLLRGGGKARGEAEPKPKPKPPQTPDR
ncbi:MAG: hypothetical protein AB1697_01070 [Pseudomonadota bacterium]